MHTLTADCCRVGEHGLVDHICFRAITIYTRLVNEIVVVLGHWLLLRRALMRYSIDRTCRMGHVLKVRVSI